MRHHISFPYSEEKDWHQLELLIRDDFTVDLLIDGTQMYVPQGEVCHVKDGFAINDKKPVDAEFEELPEKEEMSGMMLWAIIWLSLAFVIIIIRLIWDLRLDLTLPIVCSTIYIVGHRLEKLLKDLA